MISRWTVRRRARGKEDLPADERHGLHAGAADIETATPSVTYKVHCTRGRRGWLLEVPELEGVLTKARQLHEAEAMVREAIAAKYPDIPQTSFALELDARTGRRRP